MLLHVPRMYSEAEFKRLVQALPEDFEQKKAEFWGYVYEKLAVFVGKVQRVYRDGICKNGEEALNQLGGFDIENYKIARKLVDDGALFEATEDPLLIAESEGWLEMLGSGESSSLVLEMFEETMAERDRFVVKRIDETLVDDECGVLFMDPARTVRLNENVKVIKVCRFDPLDYLKSFQIVLKSRVKA